MHLRAIVVQEEYVFHTLAKTKARNAEIKACDGCTFWTVRALTYT